jgi:hypothetical protein
MGCELPFGGKVMVFGGDFRQVLLVVPRCTRAQIMDATLLRSYIWKDVHKICLTRNMRAQSDPCFLDYPLRIGNGTEDTFAGDYVRLPKDIVIEYKDEHSIDHLFVCVFTDLDRNAYSTQYMRERGILCMWNDSMDEINARMIDRIPSTTTVFYFFIRWMMTTVTIILKTFSIPSHLMVCHRTSSESRSIVPLFSFVIWTRAVVYAMELVWLLEQSISIY